MLRRNIRHFSFALLLSGSGLPVHADLTVGDLARFHQAYQRLNAGAAVTDTERHQAGYFAGYVDALREQLVRDRRACRRDCRCAAEAAIESALFDAPDPAQSAIDWLAPRLTVAQACP